MQAFLLTKLNELDVEDGSVQLGVEGEKNKSEKIEKNTTNANKSVKYAEFNARIGGKSTPKIVESVTTHLNPEFLKKFKLQHKPSDTELELQVEELHNNLRKEIEYSNNMEEVAHTMCERMKALESMITTKIDRLEKKYEEMSSTARYDNENEITKVRKTFDDSDVHRDQISQTVRYELNKFQSNAASLNASDKIQIELSGGGNMGRREYKLNQEVTYDLFMDFLTSELTLRDLIHIIDSSKGTGKDLTPEKLEKSTFLGRDIIINRIDTSYYSKISHLREPVEMLEKIKEIKLNETIITPSVLRKRLYNIRYQPKQEKAGAFWDSFDEIVRMYDRSPGVQKLSESEVRDALFDAVVYALPDITQTQFLYKHSTRNLLNIAQIKDYIIQQESALEERKEIDKSTFKTNPSAHLTFVSDNSDKVCYTCGNKGHIAKDCNETGPMCYRCRRYENHMSTNCPYSDTELERMKGNDSNNSSNNRGGLARKRKMFDDKNRNNKKARTGNNNAKTGSFRGRGKPSKENGITKPNPNPGSKASTPVTGNASSRLIKCLNENSTTSQNKDNFIRFIADSGATEHMTNSRLIFRSFESDSDIVIDCANSNENSKIKSVGIGSVLAS
ncbi:hypothetical protein TKK_0014343 [Trichogramma kaykai]